MPSVRSQVLDAIVAALNGAGKPAGLLVQRYSTRPITGALVTTVYPLQQQSERFGHSRGPLVRETLLVRLRHDAVNSAGGDADEATDAQAGWARAALMVDQTLGGRATLIEEQSIQWDAETFDKTFVRAWQDFSVVFPTLPADATLQPG